MSIFVTGASGFLGHHLLGALQSLGPVIGSGRTERPHTAPAVPWELADLETPGSIRAALERVRPSAVVHAGAMARLGACEQEARRATRVNVDATVEIASWCGASGARLLFCSTDQVFDGTRGWVRETDVCAPVNVYGTTKAVAEARARAVCPAMCVLRLALVYGRSVGGNSASEQVVGSLREGRSPTLYANEFRTPVSASCVCRLIAALLETGAALPDCLHVAGPERLSRLEFGHRLASRAGLPARFEPTLYAPTSGQAVRPADVSMSASRVRALGLPQPVSIAEAPEPF